MSESEKVGGEIALVQLTQQVQQLQIELTVKNRALNAIHQKNGNMELELAGAALEIERLREVLKQQQVGAVNSRTPAPLRAVENPAEPEAPAAEPAQS